MYCLNSFSILYLRLQESNVEGALNLTQEAKKRSDEAVSRLKTLQVIIVFIGFWRKKKLSYKNV